MRALILIAFSLALAALLPAQTLESNTDKYRILLLFAPAPADARLMQQFELLRRHKAELRERDLIVLPVLVNSGKAADADLLRTFTAGPAVAAEEQRRLRARFRVAPGDFTSILIGKDGDEKLRSREPVTAETINRTIDAMPMRKDEMRARQR